MPAKGANIQARARSVEAPAQERRIDPNGVRIQSVDRTFPTRRGEVAALAGMSLRAAPGEIVAVVGPSGCGKSTLLELICGLQEPDAGTVKADPAALMPQRDLLLPWLDATDNAFERSRPAELSGGMRQRVAFLRTLLAGKPVLALDEPFAALDALTRLEMQGWLGSLLAREPRTVVLVTHDVEEAVVLADRVVVMSPRPGRTVAELEVALAPPRHRTDADVVALRERALEALGIAK